MDTRISDRELDLHCMLASFADCSRLPNLTKLRLDQAFKRFSAIRVPGRRRSR